MREISLFTGAGGGLLGSILLGWHPVGYVEIDDYCQRVIAQRIRDGYLPDAPIFGDVRAFLREGYAAAYSGMVDVVTGGFPCQPFSVAGRGLAEKDPRNLWPQTRDVIRLVRPRFAFLENVPGLLSKPYWGTILGELAESGYAVRWRVLSAAKLGAPHKRERLWILCANSSVERPSFRAGIQVGQPCLQQKLERLRGHVADAQRPRLEERESEPGDNVQERPSAERGGQPGQPWPPEPDVGRVVDGVAHRVDRIRALGNGQVPRVVRAAWELLTEVDQ